MKQKNKLILHDTSFVDLMSRRIFKVLIVANPYDAFMLEDDGRIDEKIFDEYAKLGLRYPPRFFQAASEDEARDLMARQKFELVICMPGTETRKDTSDTNYNNNDVFDIARKIKSFSPEIPIVVLTPFSHGITKRMQNEDLSIFEYVFCWLGNTDLLISIIKLIEDKMNLKHDIEKAGVQMIMLVEDSIRFYSSILPNLYKFVLQQSHSFASEALNSQLEMLRMRGRPKIVLARNYEEAWNLYQQFKDNTLGVISDCKFPMIDNKKELRDKSISLSQTKDEQAGFKLLSAIRNEDEFVPLIMESSDSENAELAKLCNASFIDKNSKKINLDLRRLIRSNFGFGDFIFRDPNTLQEVARIKDLKDLQDNIFILPRESLLYHLQRNNVSRWLCSRALFPISEFLKKITWHSLQDVDQHRQIIYDAIVSYRRMKNAGVVATFKRDRFDRFSNFARIGDGSLGGKGRGLAFLDHIISRHPDLNKFENAEIIIPKTVVLCTDIFDEFMDSNDLYQIALSDMSDEAILQSFLQASLPSRLRDDLLAFAEVVRAPIAIRSSSLLEDAHYQPFAGVYSTYMIPNEPNRDQMFRMLSNAIKGVYASVFYRDSKAYMVATSNVIDQEKMAVILQEVVGAQYSDYFYPNISGVARSINYYPIGDEKAEEGTVDLALGLGKYIVDGGVSLRVCPYHPNQVLQTSDMDIALRETQTTFLALDTKNMYSGFKVDDGFNLLKVLVRDAEKDGSLQWICSTFDPIDQCIYDGFYEGRNRKLITFSGVLQHDVFPLPELLQMILKYGQEEMRRPVEIEFAVNLNADKTGELYLLQIRPMVDNKMLLDEDLTEIADDDCLLRSHNAIGMGIISNIRDVVYVKTENFNASNNSLIADEITAINQKFLNRSAKIDVNGDANKSENSATDFDDSSYVLIGPGRWGSNDSWLGIPVKWPNISAAKLIVEAGLMNYRVDPSQGTHFFQNLTSFGVGYFIVNDFMDDGIYRIDYLNSLPAIEETQFVRHVRLPKSMTIKIDGMKKEGVVVFDR